jgi:predicted nucleic acid-binding protein
MRYLLDTNVVSDLVRHPQGRVAEHVRAVGEANICTSIVVAAELRYGAAKKGSLRLTDQLERVPAALDVVPLEPVAGRPGAAALNQATIHSGLLVNFRCMASGARSSPPGQVTTPSVTRA